MMKKGFLFIIQLIVLITICKIGYVCTDFSHLPIPGNVIGILLLFILLQTNVIKLEWVDFTASFFVKHLAFFFIPIAVSLMTLGALFFHYGWALALVLGISLIVGFIVSALTVQKLAQKGEVKQHGNVHHHL
ncbi:murein hydrolase regulator LrgA [Peribacillus asahii]|uniref:Murein hydrolase regulator LrgA n=1 Tax=Peribacillus asahii TaxID=228899 RepID=A0A398B179_9BACI|nr:CidA/LrgA family protein [Peribacillus asahii]RID81643.1 murein hydrolase regulator LrgA [Peribacillus asahii]